MKNRLLARKKGDGQGGETEQRKFDLPRKHNWGRFILDLERKQGDEFGAEWEGKDSQEETQ